MVHIDITAETKEILNKCRGIIQLKTPSLINYDNVVKELCLYYLKTNEDKQK